MKKMIILCGLLAAVSACSPQFSGETGPIIVENPASAELNR